MVTVKNMLSVVRVTQMAARKTESLSFWVPVAVCWTRRGGAVTMAASFVCQTFLQFEGNLEEGSEIHGWES